MSREIELRLFSRPVACVAGFRRHAMPNDNGVDGDVADL